MSQLTLYRLLILIAKIQLGVDPRIVLSCFVSRSARILSRLEHPAGVVISIFPVWSDGANAPTARLFPQFQRHSFPSRAGQLPRIRLKGRSRLQTTSAHCPRARQRVNVGISASRTAAQPFAGAFVASAAGLRIATTAKTNAPSEGDEGAAKRPDVIADAITLSRTRSGRRTA